MSVAFVGIVPTSRVVIEPAIVYDGIFPAMLFQVLRHIVYGGFELLFVDARVVSVETVPAHGRSGRGLAFDGFCSVSTLGGDALRVFF